MTVTAIAILTLLSLAIGWLSPPRWRNPILLTTNLLALFALQSQTPIRSLDFWLPVASITITLSTWAAIQPRPVSSLRPALPVVTVTAILILLLAINRYLEPFCCLTPSRPPQIMLVLVASILSILLVLLFFTLRGRAASLALFLILISIFVVLKYPPLAQLASSGLREASGQDASLASALDLRWLGFSYLAFRLMGVLQDARAGRSVPVNAGEFLNYALFFPALSAGPIDRLPRFLGDVRKMISESALPLRKELNIDQRKIVDLYEGGQRIFLGLVKKFVLADSLALFALNPTNAAQAAPGFWSWVLLYAFALRIYFDFSGYTDIAIGLARLLGIRLPENFDAPYLKTNLTAFWNAWHITLAQWFRSYFFNPFTRWLRQKPGQLPAWVIILAGQVGVMLLIGIWHGMSLNFAIWGLWHAVGLFLHNRWTDFIRLHLPDLPARLQQRRVLAIVGWLLTFHFVALGWVWFALPDSSLAWNYLQKLLLP